MSIDVRDKALELCQQLANSLYERLPPTDKPIFFSAIEIDLVSEWLRMTIKDCVEETRQF